MKPSNKELTGGENAHFAMATKAEELAQQLCRTKSLATLLSQSLMFGTVRVDDNSVLDSLLILIEQIDKANDSLDEIVQYLYGKDEERK